MNINLDKNKIVLGISGGVDSTTAALLLLEKGYEVYGLYFNIHQDGEEGRIVALKALTEAYKAVKPEISTVTVENRYFIYKDVKQLFNEIVVSDFVNEYLAGRTPNPCIVCNPSIKFRLLIDAANEVGAYYIATGHYADTYTDNESGKSYIKASSSKKDQSYMLYRLPQEVVKRVVFPLASFSDKDKIREIAENMGMSNSDKKDSQEICFIEDNRTHGDFIDDWTGNTGKLLTLKEGNFINREGTVLGKHKGVVNYTIGQRKGLGIALGKPAFVTELNSDNNTVVLGENEELLKTNVIIDRLFFAETDGSDIPSDLEGKELTGKIRYAAPRACAKVLKGNEQGTVTVMFENPQRAMTPGQSLVLYDGDLVIGGGRIINVL